MITTESGVLCDAKYSVRSRFGTGAGTNPEELIAAALGGCFSIVLAHELETSGFSVKRIETSVTTTVEQLPDGPTVVRIQLELVAKVRSGTRERFIDAAKAAAKCPIARLLNTTISMNATLETNSRRKRATEV